jgi:tRNA(Ile)-lysidine synthase
LGKNTSALTEAAARLAELIPRERLDPAVLAWCDASARRQVWGVGFSGGADSLALLLLLWSHWPGRRRSLRALHFDHRLRGAESQADARFCRRVCAELGVDYVAGAWAGSHAGASEAEARSARMAFLGKHARVLWFGHQQDDIAESMLMRLARGSGAGGLAAPRPVQRLAAGRVHLRPLLTLKKEEIVAALRAARVPWREDSSNDRAAYFRNRIRKQVLPGWREAAQRDALAGAARSRLLLEEDDFALEGWLREIAPVDVKGRLRLARLDGKPRALWRRALHGWVAANPRCGDLSRQAFEILLSAVEQRRPTRQSVGTDGFAVSDGGVLWFEAVGRKSRPNQRCAN